MMHPVVIFITLATDHLSDFFFYNRGLISDLQSILQNFTLSLLINRKVITKREDVLLQAVGCGKSNPATP